MDIRDRENSYLSDFDAGFEAYGNDDPINIRETRAWRDGWNEADETGTEESVTARYVCAVTDSQ